MKNVRNILFWFMLVFMIGFLYHITDNFIIANAIGEETTISDSDSEEEPTQEELEDSCE